MGAVRFVTPQLNLTKVMAEPGGVSASEAVKRAQDNLQVLRPTCRAEMAAMLDRAEAEWAAARDARGLDALYQIAVRAIGTGEVAGTPGVDELLKSLSDLIDAFRGREVAAAAVDVHLQSWRLLMTGTPDAKAREAILTGLHAVAARFG